MLRYFLTMQIIARLCWNNGQSCTHVIPQMKETLFLKAAAESMVRKYLCISPDLGLH